MKFLSTHLSAVPLILLLSACDNNPTEGKQVAQASVPASAPAVEPSVAATGSKRLSLSEKNGTISFVGAKVTAKHEGGFEAFKGNLALGEPLETSQVTLDIDVSSLTIQPAKLRGHLLSADFFDVAKFPKARFQSTSIQALAGGAYSVTGNLELHGVTKAVTFPVQISKTPDGVDVHGEFGINRKDFGIEYPGMADDLIKDEVLIELTLKPRV